MNVLLVDDDYFVITALTKKIDWPALGIERVYTASNVAQARELLEREPVHILICDIEMPQGSGLDLLAWMREEKHEAQAIFLTNYADFNYAQKAIELRSFEYFLKPIEFAKLTLIIRKAIARVREQAENEKAIREGIYWKKSEKTVIEHFWRKLATEAKELKATAIADAIAERNLSYGQEDVFLPLLFTIFPYDKSLGKDDKGLFDFALLNVLNESFQQLAATAEAIFEYKPFNWIAIVRATDLEAERALEAAKLCEAFLPVANRILKSDACCTIARPARLSDVHREMRSLIRANEERIKHRNRVLVLGHDEERQAAYAPPDLKLLDELLNANDAAAFLDETSRYLHRLVRGQEVSVSVLGQFRLDIAQLVYAYLKSQEIQAHKLYAGRTHDQLFSQSLHSIEDMEKYLAYLLRTAMEYRDFAAAPTSVVAQITRHIHAHLGDDLTRISLAEVVYLNPDYLARLFKKEIGVSLGTYIIQARIQTAKQWLETTKWSVHDIARKVGYANYPHFSKFFKQETGCTPIDYRKQRQTQ
ncbi:helix-turn-helix domain-containing protein [Cohnella panacarvi]|uniref:helix-turn-helix domain-containing protein n=1 Tax=Cohnella panacarvi TaxID=400776 RepID=UPI00047CEFF1|nr:helix-turn-helix domain-containing protein [Cohnella panacarvi]